MRQEFPDPPFYVAIDWSTRKPAGNAMPFADRDSGIRFLQRIGNGLAAMRLRRLWQDRPGGAGPARVNEKQLLEFLADRLVKGDLQATRIPPPQGGGGSGSQAARHWTPDSTPLGTRVESPLRLAPRGLPASPVDLPQEIPVVPDVAAQVASLLAAARDGIPFCEQCAKDML
jgi:hypothetical protein